MSLTLEYDGRLLVCGNGHATIHLGKTSVEITGVVRRERVTYLSGGIVEFEHFFISIGALPNTMQAKVRSDIIEAQLEIDKNNPRRRSRSRPFYDDSPLPIEVSDDYQLVLIPHRAFRAHPCLRHGKELIVHAKSPLDGLKYSLGTITRMVVHP